MKARFLGHAAVLLTAQDASTLLVDPYNPGGYSGRMGYAPIAERPDAVVCSHDHADHCGVDDLANTPPRVADDARVGPFLVRRHRAFHDEYGGRRRGGAVDIVEVTADGHRVVHLSDVGHSPSPELVDALKYPALLFVPVGGFYTIGAAQADQWCRRLAPRQVVPMHYKTDQCGLRLRGRAQFEAYGAAASADPVGGGRGSCVEVDSAMISFDRNVVLLDPARQAGPGDGLGGRIDGDGE